MKRRDFLSGLAISSASLAAGQAAKGAKDAQPSQSKTPARAGSAKSIVICAANGINFIEDG
jgi:hypothetical protein